MKETTESKQKYESPTARTYVFCVEEPLMGESGAGGGGSDSGAMMRSDEGLFDGLTSNESTLSSNRRSAME